MKHTVIAIFLALLFIGCGKENNPTPYTGDVNNSGNVQNYLGYTGDGVIYGSVEILGVWSSRNLDTNNTFRKHRFSSEATYNRALIDVDENGTILPTKWTIHDMSYGVSEDGETLYTSDFSYTIIEHLHGVCFKVEELRANEYRAVPYLLQLCKEED